MARPEPRSIRARLLLQLGVVFAAGMVALYGAATSYARLAADSSYDRLLLGSASSIAETLSVSPTDLRADIPYAALDMLSAAPDDRVFYRVIGTDGATVTGYSDLPSFWNRRASDRDAGAARFFDASYRGETVRFVALGREVRIGGVSGWIWVQVGQTRAARASLARDLTIRALLPILGMTLLAIAVVWISVGGAVRPLKKVGDDLTARSAADLSPIDSPVPSEIAPLIGAINQFMTRLDQNIHVLRTFIADAAHQLRTPLTALMVQIRSAETNGGEVRTASIAAANQSATRLARLVDQLLSDAMVAHRAQERRTGLFDLKRTVEQSLQDSVPLMRETDVRFTTVLASAPVIGDEVMVSEAIKNLLHNALNHGTTPGDEDEENKHVDLVLKRAGDRLELLVTDTGPGMTDEALARVGERFRSNAGARGGAGLGLAIVCQVMESHRGSMRIANRSDSSGLRVELDFPEA